MGDLGAGPGEGSLMSRPGLGLRVESVFNFWLRDVSGRGIITVAVLGQTLHFEILWDREEGVEFLPRHVDFPVLHKVEHSLEVTVVYIVHPL